MYLRYCTPLMLITFDFYFSSLSLINLIISRFLPRVRPVATQNLGVVHPLPSLFLLSLKSRTPQMQLMGLGKRCKLPSGVWVGAPAEFEFGAF